MLSIRKANLAGGLILEVISEKLDSTNSQYLNEKFLK